jgi:hypothetical protein
VDGFSFERNSIEGNICKDGKSHLVCDIKHSNYDSVLTRDLRKVLVKGVKGNHKGNNHKEKNEVRKINSRREAIKKILKNIRFVDGKISLKNNEINNINMALGKLVRDKHNIKFINIHNKKLTYEEIVSYNFKSKSDILIKNNIHQIIARLVKLKNNNNNVSSNDIKVSFEKYNFDPYKFIDIAFKSTKDNKTHRQKYEKWNSRVQKSIDNNIIIIDNKVSDSISSRHDFRIYCSSLISNDLNNYHEFLDKLRDQYNLELLIIEIRDKLSSEKENITKQLKRSKNGEYHKNNIIKKTLIDFQYNNKKLLEARLNKSELKYYDEEVTSYFHKYYPVKKAKGKRDNKLNDEILLSTNKIQDYVKNKIISKSINSSIKTGYYMDTMEENTESLKNKRLEKAHLENVFLRKLSSTITYAANTLRNEISNEYFINKAREISNLNVNILGFNIFDENENSKLRDIKLRNLFNTSKVSEEEAKNIISKAFEDIYENKLYFDMFEQIIEKSKDYRTNINKIMGLMKSIFEKHKKYCSDFRVFEEKLSEDFLSSKSEYVSFDNVLRTVYYIVGNKYFDNVNTYPYIRKWIFNFRNPVFHYNNEIKGNDLSPKDPFTIMLNEDFDFKVNSIPNHEMKKLYSNSVFKHFSFENVMKLYEENGLFNQKNDIKVPSFRNVIKSYRNYSYFTDEVNEKEKFIIENLLKLDKIIESSDNSSKYFAQKYLIKRIYSCFTDDLIKYVVKKSEIYYSKKISESTDSEKYINIKKAIELNGSYSNNHSYIYSELKKAIQRDIDIQRLKDKEITRGFAFDMEKELFSIGLLNLLMKEEFNFIFEDDGVEYDFKEEEIIFKFENYMKDKSLVDVKLDIEEENILIYPLYGVLKLLSKSRLSELYSNILSYKQAVDEFGLSEKLFETGDYYINIDDLFIVVSVMMQTYENFSYTDNGITEEYYFEILKEFIKFERKQDLGDFNKLLIGNGVRDQLYIQNDNESFVYFSQIIEASKENLLEKYKLFYEENKITKEQVSVFAMMELTIEKKVNEKEDLKKKMKGHYNNNYHKDDVIKYSKLNNEIIKYNRLKNRLLLNDISKMNRLLIDLYSRYTSLLSVFEKNLYYLYSQEGIELAEKENLFAKFANESSNNKIKNIREYFYHSDGFDNTIRNNFAHFHYLRGTSKTQELTFIEQLNELRYLLSMDRKLKNAVTKIAINVFEKHGFDLSFVFKNHKIDSYELSRKKSNDIYLKGRHIDAGDDYFLSMINNIVFNNQ